VTPAINTAAQAKIEYVIHEYAHDPSAGSYGLEAAIKLGLPAERVFKTLVVSLGGKGLAVGVVPVSAMLDLKRFAKEAGVKKVVMAEAPEVERATGYVLGGISPLGQKKRLPTLVDSSADNYGTVFVSAGRRGLEIELQPQDLLSLTSGRFADIAKQGS
jgi:Cys-tRNA(Pro)/Cys-tRNA(Cys) deacylase